MSQIELVIFDCDGVLVDSEIIANRVEMNAYKGLGFEMEESAFNERFAGMTGREIKYAIEDELGYDLPDSLLEEIRVQIDAELHNSVTMIEGADQVVGKIAQPFCICSNSSLERLGITLGKTGLVDHFKDRLFSTQDIDGVRTKPEPDVFLHAMNEFGIAPDKTIIIEDSVHGVTGAVASGARVVGFTGASHTWPTHADSLSEAGAETVINRLAAFPPIIEVMGNWQGLG